MDKIEQRAVIKFLHVKGTKRKDIYDELKNVLGECAPSYATIKNWVAEFKRGHSCVQDEAQPGRPKSVTTPEMVVQEHDIVLTDQRLKLSETADTTETSMMKKYAVMKIKSSYDIFLDTYGRYSCETLSQFVGPIILAQS
ncbi:uncharacterized protein LOC114245880 [Bombyx mandarina]|uniref:Uncharacterized protein LOC114245880 n=1 Tax=Bombyx mandarina TaxID=7092 RepID=A0A6J2JYV0_BOMMA|nr:uncharacterized protein LOC114245880 [Bombyx mandarina]